MAGEPTGERRMGMNILIYGAGNNGRILGRKILEEGYADSFMGYVDKNYEHNKSLERSIYSLVQLETFDKNTYIIISLGDIYEAYKTIFLLENKGFRNLYLVNPHLYEGDMDIFAGRGKWGPYVNRYLDTQPILPYFEFQVIDSCNLNCKGCSHFSNLMKKGEMAKIEDYSRSIYALSNLFANVATIRLMGGEPFLNPQLGEFVTVTRRIFPYSSIRIVTNGILICQMDSELISVIRNNGIVLDVSQYPVTKRNLYKIIEFLDKNKIQYTLSPLVDKFFVNLSHKRGDADISYYKLCLSWHCHMLRNNRLYPCPRIPLAFENRKELDLQMEYEDLIESSADLDKSNNGWDILRKIYQPMPACVICTKERFIKWEVSGNIIDIEDYYAE